MIDINRPVLTSDFHLLKAKELSGWRNRFFLFSAAFLVGLFSLLCLFGYVSSGSKFFPAVFFPVVMIYGFVFIFVVILSTHVGTCDKFADFIGIGKKYRPLIVRLEKRTGH